MRTSDSDVLASENVESSSGVPVKHKDRNTKNSWRSRRLLKHNDHRLAPTLHLEPPAESMFRRQASNKDHILRDRLGRVQPSRWQRWLKDLQRVDDACSWYGEQRGKGPKRGLELPDPDLAVP